MKEKAITFCGVPMVRLLPIRGGWQVQQRSSDTSDDWQDVADGWFKTRAQAEEEAPNLCHF